MKQNDIDSLTRELERLERKLGIMNANLMGSLGRVAALAFGALVFSFFALLSR